MEQSRFSQRKKKILTKDAPEVYSKKGVLKKIRHLFIDVK